MILKDSLDNLFIFSLSLPLLSFSPPSLYGVENTLYSTTAAAPPSSQREWTSGLPCYANHSENTSRQIAEERSFAFIGRDVNGGGPRNAPIVYWTKYICDSRGREKDGRCIRAIDFWWKPISYQSFPRLGMKLKSGWPDGKHLRVFFLSCFGICESFWKRRRVSLSRFWLINRWISYNSV